MHTLTKIGIAVAAAVITAGAGAGAALAQDAAAAVEARQQIFKDMDTLWQPLLPMARRAPDAAAVAGLIPTAAELKALAEQIAPAFEQDTRNSGVATEALNGIWTSKADFDMKAAALVEKFAALETAAESGNGAAVRAAVIDIGRNGCAPCHDNYRAD